ncbi:FtsK/SpoIIIE domain-containing protein [Clostridium perfringens]|uniref:FtsK/SpoIIIE domain-containing protein n=1 Tax=Clostridium perfringens TaxID=1502 RepID=UPI002469B0B6|nr:FtsK/SpoIIIE domain-containing protein [Clostridium perfringens]MDH5087415.1 DNA translocase FtsK [Clostridium perfringens]MDM0520009.1 FtsK/SpoIIIE domain-containing protein [Clostridium perfringens]MDM0657403.1 FtsK/SpoIIIE domain-containing protein [Clostridium perfringens]MDM0944561.1 FtsK/SpoIIIE domain-containing protein [Clostridium perfringens]
MIAEALIISSVLAGSVYYKFSKDSREKRDVINRWNNLMQSLEKTEANEEKFKVSNVILLENKIIFDVEIASGKSFNSLVCRKNEIENAFKGICILEQVKFSNKAKITIITRNIMDFMFEPVFTKPNELYIGKKISGENHIIDVTKACHLLICAPTGMGKSYLLASIATNLLYNAKNDIEIHLNQIMKTDLAVFQDCKPVKFVGFNLNEVVLDLEKVYKKLEKRNDLLKESGCKNLEHFNKYNHNNKLKRIYLFIEEISFFMPNEDDKEDVKLLKDKAWEYIKAIAKAGRAPGIHLIGITQRSTISNLPSDIKSCMCRISLKQFSAIDSRNIIETDDAIYLEDRECICYGDGNLQQVIKIPQIDEDFKVLQQYVKEIRIPSKISYTKNTSKNKEPVIKEVKNNVFINTNNNIEVNNIIPNRRKNKKRKGVIRDDNG